MSISPEDALKGMTVVVADDDDVTRGLLRQLLRQCHLQVIGEARDGKQALEIFRKLKPQIMFLDVQMPEMNGLETLAAIRTEDSDAIVIIITGSATSAVVKSAIDARADGIIAKPFSAAKILKEINRCLTRTTQKKPASPTAPAT